MFSNMNREAPGMDQKIDPVLAMENAKLRAQQRGDLETPTSAEKAAEMRAQITEKENEIKAIAASIEKCVADITATKLMNISEATKESVIARMASEKNNHLEAKGALEIEVKNLTERLQMLTPPESGTDTAN